MANCPACEATATGVPIHEFSARQAAQCFVLAEEFPERHDQLTQHIRSLWGGDTCRVLACPACGLYYAWPFVAGDGLFYNLAYPYSAYPSARWEWDETVRSLTAAPPAEGRVLEIGSGFGYFLRHVSPGLFSPQRVLAVEYNDTARARLQAQGYTAIGQDIRTRAFDAYRGQVGAACLFQVLEHMDDLGGVVRRLNELLRPGASIYIAVPNPHRIEFNETHGSLYDMPPNHISRWTENAFQALAARAGWTLLEHRTEPMSWRGLIKEDLVYAHMRRAQRSGSLANRVRSRPRSGARVAMEGALALLAAPARLGAWHDAWRSHLPMGGSVWVHLRFEGLQ